MYKLKHFFKKLFRVLKAIPVIWNCEEWDYSLTLELLKWRLEECAKYFKNANVAEEDSASYKEIKEVIKAIDTYFDPEEAFKEEHGKLSFNHTFVFVPTENNTSRLMDIDADTGKALTQEQEDEYLDMAVKKPMEFEQKLWDNIWDKIKECGQGWWN